MGGGGRGHAMRRLIERVELLVTKPSLAFLRLWLRSFGFLSLQGKIRKIVGFQSFFC